MCFIITIAMLGFSIQSFLLEHWFMGVFQLLVAVGFTLLLIRNIQAARRDKQSCSTIGCGEDWLTRLFQKKK